MVVPSIIKEEDGVKTRSDIYSRLLDERIILVEGEVRADMANAIVAQLLLLEMEDPNADITMYINSPGGEVAAGLAITDAMEFISCDVCTVGMGMQASMGSFILASGTPGKRFALKRSSIMIHRLSGGVNGNFHDMEANFRHAERLNKELTEDYVRLTGGKVSTEQLRYDNWLTPEEALDLGLIDGVITDRKSLERKLKNEEE